MRPAALRGALRLAVDGILGVALAPACAACARVLDSPAAGPVCTACWDAVVPIRPPLCGVCGDPLPSWRSVTLADGRCARCRRRPPAFDRAAAAGEYDGALREIVHALKYGGRRSLARPLAAWIRSEAGTLIEGADVAVPVPLHRWRRLRRGFNQADELARGLGVPVREVLRRVRPTVPQAGLRPAERRRNVRDAFEVAGRVSEHLLADRCVLLVDDVRTTGATLDACARALKDAGAAEVRAVTVARAAFRS